MAGKYAWLAAALVIVTVVWILAPTAALAQAPADVYEVPVLPMGEPLLEPVAPMPGGLVVLRAETRGEATDKLARMSLEIALQSHRDGEQRILLFPADVAVTDWSVSKRLFGGKAYVRRNASGDIELVVEDKGKYTLTLDYVVSVHKERLGYRVALPIVSGLATETRLTLPGEEIELTADPEVSMEKVSRNGKTDVTLYGGAGMVALSWSPKAPEKVLKPVVFADQTLNVRIGQGVMRLECVLDYSIIQGGVKEFNVRFPTDCSLLNIEGDDIRTWDIEESTDPSAPRLLKVSLLGEAKKDYRLAIRLEKVLPQIEMAMDLPSIEPLGVIREKGQIAISAAKGISVEAIALKDISHVDVREMQGLDSSTQEDVRLGFRYLKRPFTLTLRMGEVVAKTSAEIQTLVRAGLDSMRLVSKLNYTIRDAGVFQFRVRLDEGLKLIDIKGPNINNWQLDDTGRMLTVALRSKAEGEYALQIETELENSGVGTAAVPSLHAMDVDREAGYVAVVAAPGIKVETSKVTGISQIDVKELPQDMLMQSPVLAYRYIRPDYAVAVKISEIAPEVLAEARTIATLMDHELKLDTSIHYTIRRAGIFQLRVAIPKDLRRTNIEGNDIDDTSWDEQTGILTVNLRSKVTDAYVLRIQTDKTLKQLSDGVTLPVLKAMDVKKERGFVAIVTKASVRVKPAEDGMTGLDDVSLSDLPPEMLQQAGQVAIAFKYFTQPWTLALAVEPIKPRVTAEVFNLLSIGENLMTVSATINCTILHAGVDTFAVKLPLDATAVDIDGDSIKHREQDKKTGIWTITLQSKRTDRYTLYASFQQKLADNQVVIPYAGIEMQNLERETGYLAITSRPDVQLTVSDADIESLTPIDSREIPQNYMAGVTLPVLHAYRYVSHPYVIRMGTFAHAAADVTVSVVESARLSTTVTEEGNMITDMVCMLRNSRQQYLDLVLPSDARIWHAFVAGKSVTPLRDGVFTKIPVARAAGDKSAFAVRLRFSDTSEAFGRMGSLRLELPLRGIDIMRLGWTLSMPKGYDLVRDTGNMQRLESLRYMEALLQNLNPDVEVSVEAARGMQMNQANMSRQAIRNIDSNVLIWGAQKKVSQTRSIYTGSKPIQPNSFVFQSLLVTVDPAADPSEAPAWVEVGYVKGSIGIPLKGLVVVLVAIVCGLFWRKKRYARMARVGIMIVAAVAVLALRTLAEGTYQDYLTTIIYTLLIIAGFAFVCTVVTGIKEACLRRRGRKTATITGAADVTVASEPTTQDAPESKPESEIREGDGE